MSSCMSRNSFTAQNLPIEAPVGYPVGIAGRRPSGGTSRRASGDRSSEKEHKCLVKGRKGEDVAAKSVLEHGGGRTKQEKRMQVAGLQPFYIPAKVPEHTVAQTPTSQNSNSNLESSRMEVDDGQWISGGHQAHVSRNSMASSIMSNSTLVDCSQSILSGGTSIASSDMYGWEEEWDRKVSLESKTGSELDVSHDDELKYDRKVLTYRRANGKTKELLYKVLRVGSSQT